MKHSHKQRPHDVAPIPRYGSPGSMLSSVSYGYIRGIKQNYNSRLSDPINPSTVRDPRFRGGRLPPLPTEAWARQRWHDFFWRRTGGRFGMSVPVKQNEAKEEGRKIGQAAGYIVGLYKAFERPSSGAVLPSRIARIGVNMFNDSIDKHNAKIREHNRERYAQQRGKRMMTKNAQQRQVRNRWIKAGFDPKDFKAPMQGLRTSATRLQQFLSSRLSSALRTESQRLSSERLNQESRHANDVGRMYGMAISDIARLQQQIDSDLRFGRFENVVRNLRKLSTQARNVQRDLRDEARVFKRQPYTASVGNTLAQASSLSGKVASDAATLYNRATQAMRQYIAETERTRRNTSMIKQSAGRYPLGTLKLLAQTMPKEIRSLRLAQNDLRQAGSAISGVRDQRVKAIMAVLRRLDAKLKQQIVARQREFKEIAQELKQRGESASDIVGLYGRRSASSKLDIGPINIRIRNPKQIAKLQSQIRELKSKIKLTEQQIKMDINTAKQIKRAADFLGDAAHELELAENMIPGTQMGTLTLQFGNAMRRMDGAYQAMQTEIKGNQAALNSMKQQEKKLHQALQHAGG